MAEFALDLDHDAIALLRRSGDGWERLGEARLDAPDLDARLKALQGRASSLSSGALKTELVIPASQILHLGLEMEPGFEDVPTEAAAAAVAEAIHVRTSSAPGDVAFDWMADGASVRAAVVSVDTLREARAFAAAYGFNPVRARAWPDAEGFPDHAEFGALPEPAAPAPPPVEPEPEPERRPEPRPAPTPRAAAPTRRTAATRRAQPDPSGGVPRGLLLAGAVAGLVAVASAVTLTLLPGEEATDVALAPPEIAEPRTAAPTASPAPEPRPFDPEPVVVPVPDAGAPEPQADPAPEPEAPEPETPAAEPAPDAEPGGAEEARTRYAATGIWQTPPAPLPAPEPLEAAAPPVADPAPVAPTVTPGPLVPPTARDTAPTALPPPPPPGTTFALGPDGRVEPTPEGAPSPDGILLYAGTPPIRPPARPPETILPPGRVFQDPALAGFRPAPRPDGAPSGPASEAAPVSEAAARPSPAEAPPGAGTPDAEASPGTEAAVAEALAAAGGAAPDGERAREGDGTSVEQAVADALAGAIEPRLSLLPTGPGEVAAPSPRSVDAAVAASLFRAAESPVALSVAGPTLVAEETASAFAAARSLRPVPRPDDPPRPAPVQAAAPVVAVAAEPAIPTRASVARRATVENVLALNRMSLVGVFGAEGARRALIRLPSGRFEKVAVGDRLDGGRVQAIRDGGVIYVRAGRSYALEMPRG